MFDYPKKNIKCNTPDFCSGVPFLPSISIGRSRITVNLEIMLKGIVHKVECRFPLYRVLQLLVRIPSV